MPLHAYNSDIVFSAPLTLGFSDAVVVGSQGYVYGQGGLFISLEDFNRISVAGTIASGGIGAAIVLGSEGDQTIGSHLVVTPTGMVFGQNALQVFGGSCRVDNAGTIVGTMVFNGGTSGYGNVIQNSGTIAGAEYGVLGYVYQATEIWIYNSGVISGAFNAIAFADSQNLADRVVNSGLINGVIALGGGSDLYDGRGGGTVIGSIGGGPGDDRFRPGAAEEVFDGGNGSDTLDFRGGGGAMAIALDNSFDADGWAEGDQWSGIENVTGSRGADRIGGDSAANALNGAAGDDSISGGSNQDTLEGGDGNDTLAGGSASDTLTGGSGIDTLTGGSGNDAFLFRRLGEIGDVITDFSSSASGNDDRIGVSQSGFGAGLALGALAASRFRARADNVAQDADDRFIFRGTDQTLWFDSDGNGGAAAVLLADLQPGASMTAADIVIF